MVFVEVPEASSSEAVFDSQDLHDVMTGARTTNRIDFSDEILPLPRSLKPTLRGARSGGGAKVTLYVAVPPRHHK